MLLEVFQAAVSKDPPAGIGHFPLSRAIYGIDLLLQWSTNEKGKQMIIYYHLKVLLTPQSFNSEIHCDNNCQFQIQESTNELHNTALR